jgi:hypothetical protein
LSWCRYQGKHLGKVASEKLVEIADGGDLRGDVIGLCDQIKNLLGRGDIQGPPAVDFAQRDLPADQQRPEQHASGIRAGQHALGLDAPLELLVQPLDGVGGADGLPLVAWEAQEGEEFFARFFQAVGDRAATRALRVRSRANLRSASRSAGGGYPVSVTAEPIEET